MSAAWLEDILPYSWVSAKTRIWWLIFFALFPLAYVGGVLLELSEDSPARIAGAEDRAAPPSAQQRPLQKTMECR